MNLCVTGGAGYIGSFIVRQLCDAGHDVLVIDNLSKGHRSAVDGRARLAEVDCGDGGAVEPLLREHAIDAVVHMAASSLVGESVDRPDLYYRNNVVAGVNLLDAMIAAGVGRMVFSSTAATYGEPEQQPITEQTPQTPINPYGRSKLIFERILADYAKAFDFGAIALRYFNVAGGAADGSIGEDHEPETHLIPIVFEAAAGRRDAITIFGNDYPTPDGTCVRDYIHVEDLADAHVRAVEAVEAHTLAAFNLGNGDGFSVRQVIESAERVVGREIPRKPGDRRPGDPPTLVASSEKIARELGWRAARADLDTIIADAWAFHRRHPHGYAE